VAGAQCHIAASIATGPWQLVGEQVLIGPVTVPVIVRKRSLSSRRRHPNQPSWLPGGYPAPAEPADATQMLPFERITR